MATTHKLSPQRIAQQVLADNEDLVVRGDMTLESLIMLGIAAYIDASNQRPENLSEACKRLGINLHWVPSSHAPVGTDSYYVYFGHQAPLSSFTTEADTVIEIEELRARYPEVNVWVEAVR
jgi:hypothetical protein